MASTALRTLPLLTVVALLGSGSPPTADAAAVTTLASTTTTSTAAPVGGLTIGRWRITPGAASGKVEPRVVQTAPLPEVGLGGGGGGVSSGVGDVLTGTKLAMAQKLLEHPLIAKIIRPIVDFVSGTNAGVDGTGGELLNPSYFGSSFSFPFAFRSNFFKSANATTDDEVADAKMAQHADTDASNKEASPGNSVQARDAKAVRPGGGVQHYRLAVAKRSRPSAPMPAP